MRFSASRFCFCVRSLVALSLILSLLLFKPAPLYILDEVDAALDLSHTQNIGQMLKTHFRHSQVNDVSFFFAYWLRKCKAFNTYIATDRAGLQPVDHRLNARAHGLWPVTKQPYAALVYRLMVSIPVIYVITWITTHLPTPEGWKAELAWLVELDPQWTPSAIDRSYIDQGNFTSQLSAMVSQLGQLSLSSFWGRQIVIHVITYMYLHVDVDH